LTQKRLRKTKDKKVPPVIKADDQDVLVATLEYPYAKWKFEKFNPVQSRIMDFYNKDNNGLIAAMTSAGKTVVAEMFLAQEVRERGGKGMFLAPLRALAREKITDWTNKDYHFADQKISICTGDYRLTKERSKELNESNLIVMTSEMLNHRSRNYKSEQNNWLKSVGTLVVDECLPPSALVETDKGLIPIGQIIDQNLDVKVASFNHNLGVVEYKKIVARQKKLLKRKWRTIYYNGGNISVTDNHLVWCESRGYVPSKNINVGDVLYVRKIEPERKTSDFGNFVRRWFNFSFASWKISEVENSTIFCPKGFCRVEVQRIEETGWHATENKIERRLRQRNMHFQYALNERNVGDIFNLLSKWEKNSELGLVEHNQRSNCSCGMVYGRRKSRLKSDGNAYRRLFSTRSRNVVELVARKMGYSKQPLFNEKLLATTISSGRQRQISRFDTSFNDAEHGVQSFTKDGENILFDVWSGICCQPSRYSCDTQSIVMWEQRMSAQMGQNVRTNENLDSEESWCCDLEVESDSFENSNFFADGVMVHNCHLLTVPGRGDHLEVGLMKFTEINPKARLVLLSATMPNVEEIADWISYSLTKRSTFMLRSKYRPVPLTVHYESYFDQGKYDQIEEEKVNKAMDIIDWYPDDKFLVFAHTKRTGELMKQSLRSAGIESQFHNADLEANERAKVEDRFRNDPKLRVIVATSTLAWGLNLPARRVVILGVNRGINEVESHDILQMIGRSGRLGIDPMGDAYILVPESEEKKYRQKFSQPNRIESQLLAKLGDKHKVLAFHLVSEIHHGDITTTDDVHEWYKRSLAYFQNKSLEEKAVDETLDLLSKCGAIYQDEGKWKCRAIGKVSSMFYFSPFDVSNLFYNFKNLFERNKEDDDYSVAMSLADIDSQRIGIVSRIEKQEMEGFANKVRNMFPGKNYVDSVLKIGFCYHNLLNGKTPQACASIQRNLQFDFNRFSQVLQSLDSLGGKWDQEGYFKILEGRITNGVPAHLVNLCRLPSIGKTRANNLYNAGFKTVEAVANMNFEKFKSIANMSTDSAKKIMEDAKNLAMI
jgi:helicase